MHRFVHIESKLGGGQRGGTGQDGQDVPRNQPLSVPTQPVTLGAVLGLKWHLPSEQGP